MEYKSSRLFASLSPTKIIFPDTIELDKDRLRVIKKRWFGLTGDEEEISYDRIASSRLKKGVFTATVAIETSGGSKDDITIKALWKKDAESLKSQLEKKTQV